MQKLSELFGKICSASERGKKGVLVDLQTISEIRDEFWALKQRAEAAEAKHSELSDWYEKMKSRLLAAEAKLAELAKQKPVGTVSIAMEWSTHRNVATVNMRHDLVVSEMKDGDELFTRPAPTADLADLVPDELTREAWRQLLINEDYQDTFRSGFSACRAAILRNIEVAK